MADISKITVPNSSGTNVTYDFKDTQARTDVANSFKEAFLTWGGKNLTGTYAPIDSAMNPVLSANRLAGFKSAGTTIEYSTDNGSTWNTYTTTDGAKTALFTTQSLYYLGGPSATAGSTTANNKLRITIDGIDGQVYTQLNKIHMYVSTNGSAGPTVTVESSPYSNPTVFSTVASNVPLSGWTGWNVINFTLPGTGSFGGSNSSTHQRKIRFTFSNTGCTSTYSGLQIIKIYGYGGVGWTTPSTMAANGVPYTYDYAGNVTIPASLTVSGTINGTFNGTASVANKLGTSTIGSGTNPIYLNNGSPIASNSTIGTASKPVYLNGGVITAVSSLDGSLLNSNSVTNAKLANSSVTIAGTAVSLGGSISAATLKQNLGITNVMRYIGKTTTTITDGSTTNPITINGSSVTAVSGDVVIDNSNDQEYVWNGAWQKLGGSSSYKVIQSSVPDPTASGSARAFIDMLSQDTNGTITATKKYSTYIGNATSTSKLYLAGTTDYGTINSQSYVNTNVYMTNGILNLTSLVGTGTISIGRLSGSSEGYKSNTIGYEVTAEGQHSYAEGYKTYADHSYSHAEGYCTKAHKSTERYAGNVQHVEGMNNVAKDAYSYGTRTSANYVSGTTTYTVSVNDWGESVYVMHTGGGPAMEDSIKLTLTTDYTLSSDNKTLYLTSTGVSKIPTNWTGVTLNAITEWTTNKFLHIVGNGYTNNNRSNAYALDFLGNGRYNKDVYVNCNADSTGGNKVIAENLNTSDRTLVPTTAGTYEYVYKCKVTVNSSGTVTGTQYGWYPVVES